MNETVEKNLFWLAVALVSFGLLYALQPVLSPFAIAALLAYLGDPLADRLEARGLSRTWAVCVVFAVTFLVITIILLLLIPMLTNQIDLFRQVLPNYIAWVQKQVLPWLQGVLGIDEASALLDKIRLSLSGNWDKAGDVATSVIAQVGKSSLAIAGWLGTLALIPVVAFYLLRDWDVLVALIYDLLPRSRADTVASLATECDSVLSAFLRGQLMIMFALGFIYSLGLSIIGLDLALLLGIVAGLASVVPYLGVIVGIASAGIAAVVQFQDWIYLLPVLLVFGLGQLLESLILTPILVGDRIGLHPVAVIFAVLAGGQLFGFLGVLLALPVAAVAMVMIRHGQKNYKDSAFYQDEKPDVEN